MTAPYLNLGCGSRFHPDWVNLDLHPTSPSVQQWDLRKDLPFPDESFDVVYHSHVLEHFSREDGLKLLKSCRRVLRRNGIVRVAVPDLERIAKSYLDALDKAAHGLRGGQLEHQWAVLELYDQAVRERSGGAMLDFLRNNSAANLDFVIQRHGEEVKKLLGVPQDRLNSHQDRFWSIVSQAKTVLTRTLIRLITGREGIRAFDLGRFRLSGEIHYYMYDRVSLALALQSAGFSSPRRVGPAESAVPRWKDFDLDTEPDGRTYKPDSLFMEAVNIR